MIYFIQPPLLVSPNGQFRTTVQVYISRRKVQSQVWHKYGWWLVLKFQSPNLEVQLDVTAATARGLACQPKQPRAAGAAGEAYTEDREDATAGRWQAPVLRTRLRALPLPHALVVVAPLRLVQARAEA